MAEPIILGKKKKKKGLILGETTTRKVTPVRAEEDGAIQLGKKKVEEEDVIQLGKKKTFGQSFKEQVKKSVELPAGDPRSLKTTGVLGAILGTALGAGAIIGAAGAESAAVTQLNIQSIRAGGSAYFTGNALKAGPGASQFALNEASKISTTNWLTRLFSSTKLVTKKNLLTGTVNKSTVTTTSISGVGAGGAVGTALFLVGAIGTYPFAGFIKEEALQTLSLGVRSAVANEDIEGAEEALDFQEQVLDKAVWERIVAAIPYTNVVKELRDYYKSARIKADIDRQVVNDLKIKQETGETEAEKWARIDKEREDAREQQRIDDDEYFNQIRENAKEARKQQRKDDEKYWNNIFKERAEREKEKREAEETYWEGVRRENQVIKDLEREANEKYWEEVRKQSKSRERSTVQF